MMVAIVTVAALFVVVAGRWWSSTAARTLC